MPNQFTKARDANCDGGNQSIGMPVCDCCARPAVPGIADRFLRLSGWLVMASRVLEGGFPLALGPGGF